MQTGLPFPLREIVNLPDSHRDKNKDKDKGEKRKSRLRRLTIRVESGTLPLPSARFSRGDPHAFDLSPYSTCGPLSRLTHLEILSSSSSSSSSSTQKQTLFKGYETLPCLTHLAIDAWTHLNDVKRLFNGLPTSPPKSKLKLVVLLARTEARASATRKSLSESTQSDGGGGNAHWGSPTMGDGWDREGGRGVVVFPWDGMPRTLMDGMDGWSWVEWFAFRMESAMRP